MIALWLGGARCVWDDLRRASQLVGRADTVVVACNFAGIEFSGRLDVWVTLHPEAFQPWRASRADLGLNADYRAITHKPHPPTRSEVVPQGWYGSSGLYMAQVALEVLGVDGVILCGVPMEAAGQHIQTPGAWANPDVYRPAFLEAKASGADIRSMSGWTAEVLGRPDAEWLASHGIAPPVDANQLLQSQSRRTDPMRIQMKRDRTLTLEDRRTSVKFRAGWVGTTKREWGDQLVADGDAIEVKGAAAPDANGVRDDEAG